MAKAKTAAEETNEKQPDLFGGAADAPDGSANAADAETGNATVDTDGVVDVEGVIVDAEDDGEMGDSRALAMMGESLATMATRGEIDAAIDRLLARVEATKRYKVALLSMTNYRDWYAHTTEGDPDGIPYLAESGAEKIIHAFAIEVEHDGGKTCPSHDANTGKVDGYEVVYTGRMRALRFSDIWFPIVGSRWSGDGFFSRGGKRRVDPGDVRKAAWTNWMNRGIKTVCGLRSLTWDELEAIPHLKDLRKRVTKIGFTSQDGGRSSTPGEKSDIAKGPHIVIRLKYNDKKNQARVKEMKPWNWNGDEKVWEVPFNKKNAGRVADMKAEDGDAVAFTFRNVPKEELP